jgi:hypothetical protein
LERADADNRPIGAEELHHPTTAGQNVAKLKQLHPGNLHGLAAMAAWADGFDIPNTRG